jgi:DNA polymerase III delta prime subunit
MSNWLKKYRATSYDDFITDDLTKQRLQKIDRTHKFQNLIISGPCGVGKSNLVSIILNHVLGKHMKSMSIILLSFHDRGMKAINDLEMFCKKKIDSAAIFKYKIIVFEDIENVTYKSQNLINNLMEKYKSSIRFIFSCRNYYDVIESIQSKTNIIKLNTLDNDQILHRLKTICLKEQISYDKSSLDYITYLSNGDIRIAINNLNIVCQIFKEIKLEYIYKICYKPNTNDILFIISNCLTKNYSASLDKIDHLIKFGYFPLDLMTSMLHIIRYNETIFENASDKMKFIEIITFYIYKCSKSVNSNILLTSLIIELSN